MVCYAVGRRLVVYSGVGIGICLEIRFRNQVRNLNCRVVKITWGFGSSAVGVGKNDMPTSCSEKCEGVQRSRSNLQ